MELLDIFNLVNEDLWRSLKLFAPELVLVGTIVTLLVVRLFQRTSGVLTYALAFAGTLTALIAAAGLYLSGHEPRQIFGGMLAVDGLTHFFRFFLLSFAVLMAWLSLVTRVPAREDAADYFTLLLGATVGMLLMTSSVHLLMVFMAVEMASLPSYALAGFLKEDRRASEASLKYVVFGAGASGIMLYGMSLLAGRYESAHLPTLALQLAQHYGSLSGPEALEPILVAGFFLILVGVAFKIAAVPFHFWCPDVFQGAAAEVAGFLSVASKGAALGLLLRFAVLLTEPWSQRATELPALAQGLAWSVGMLAALTATYGNLAAYAQTNLKRLLAFSTIAHAGYMMMPIAAALTRVGSPRGARVVGLENAADSVLFYLAIYLFMNLGAFAVVALIRDAIGSEDLRDYAGLVRRNPLLTVAMAVFLLSLTGIPPLAGFAAKFRIFEVLYKTNFQWLLAVGLANTVFSLFYYVKVLRVMILDEPPGEQPRWELSAVAVAFCMVLLLANFAPLAPGVWDALQEVTTSALMNRMTS
jgi:NADH-quinone oxidoreductase subunit N